MEVHPPHGGIHNWRDFFIHLITITIGLLIALGLEALAEAWHHRQIVQEARADIREEIQANQKNITEDLAFIKADEERVQSSIQTLLLIRAGQKLENRSLIFHFEWSSLGNSAWKTAQSSGALSYMNFKKAQDLAAVYSMQDSVRARTENSQWDHALSIAPLFVTGDPGKMSQAEVQLSLQRSADLLMNLRSIEQILAQLDAKYREELPKL